MSFCKTMMKLGKGNEFGKVRRVKGLKITISTKSVR